MNLTEVLLIVLVIFFVAGAILLSALLFKRKKPMGKDTFDGLFVGLKATNDVILAQVKDMAKEVGVDSEKMRAQTAEILEKMRTDNERLFQKTLTENKESMKALQESNEKNLQTIRESVDEKLSKTLSDRLEESFKVVTNQLGEFNKQFGVMNELTNSVTSLQKTMTGVKPRGLWGEMQLEALISDILTPEQYEKQSRLGKRGRAEAVDFAVILPGQGEKIYLPIDAKFPVEDYQRMYETSDLEEFERARKAFIVRIKSEARSIQEKYIVPNVTTDYALLYLPNEGLYSEVLRQNGLAEELQRQFHVVPAGPTNIAAILTSLKMGFQAQALQKNVKEVAKTLSSFRKDFTGFFKLVEKAQDNIRKTGQDIDGIGAKTRLIDERLRKIDRMLPDQQLEELTDVAEEN